MPPPRQIASLDAAILARFLDGTVRATKRCAMSFGIYLVGIVLLISGLVYAASILNAPAQWIVVGTLVMLGAGVIAAVKNTRQRDPAE
jgi:hypothetical protein